jgi:hypothetical protein
MIERFFQRVRWIHDDADDPVALWADVMDGYEVRKVDEFADGRLVWADVRTESGSTRLCLTSLPTPDEIAADPQFVVEMVSADVFERVRRRARRETEPPPRGSDPTH